MWGRYRILKTLLHLSGHHREEQIQHLQYRCWPGMSACHIAETLSGFSTPLHRAPTLYCCTAIVCNSAPDSIGNQLAAVPADIRG